MAVPDAVCLVSLDSDGVHTKYFPGLIGGKFEERYRHERERNQFVLDLSFEHELLDEPIEIELRSHSQIDTPRADAIRSLFAERARAS